MPATIEPEIGRPTRLEFGGYSRGQQAAWDALADVYFAYQGGYLPTRHPSPGQAFGEAHFKAWQAKCIEAWQEEAYNRTSGWAGPRYRGIDAGDLPEHVWLYLYERMLAA